MKDGIKETGRYETGQVTVKKGVSTTAGPNLPFKHEDIGMHINTLQCEAAGGLCLVHFVPD